MGHWVVIPIGKTELLGDTPVQVPLGPLQTPTEWPGLGLKPDLRCDRPAAKILWLGTAREKSHSHKLKRRKVKLSLHTSVGPNGQFHCHTAPIGRKEMSVRV
jgi:hypothetical protein